MEGAGVVPEGCRRRRGADIPLAGAWGGAVACTVG